MPYHKSAIADGDDNFICNAFCKCLNYKLRSMTNKLIGNA